MAGETTIATLGPALDEFVPFATLRPSVTGSSMRYVPVDREYSIPTPQVIRPRAPVSNLVADPDVSRVPDVMPPKISDLQFLQMDRQQRQQYIQQRMYLKRLVDLKSEERKRQQTLQDAMARQAQVMHYNDAVAKETDTKAQKEVEAFGKAISQMLPSALKNRQKLDVATLKLNDAFDRFQADALDATANRLVRFNKDTDQYEPTMDVTGSVPEEQDKIRKERVARAAALNRARSQFEREQDRLKESMEEEMGTINAILTDAAKKGFTIDPRTGVAVHGQSGSTFRFPVSTLAAAPGQPAAMPMASAVAAPAGKSVAQAKAERANAIAASRPGLTRGQVIALVEAEFAQRQ